MQGGFFYFYFFNYLDIKIILMTALNNNNKYKTKEWFTAKLLRSTLEFIIDDMAKTLTWHWYGSIWWWWCGVWHGADRTVHDDGDVVLMWQCWDGHGDEVQTTW
jgi:hypothetical protein